MDGCAILLLRYPVPLKPSYSHLHGARVGLIDLYGNEVHTSVGRDYSHCAKRLAIIIGSWGLFLDDRLESREFVIS